MNDIQVSNVLNEYRKLSYKITLSNKERNIHVIFNSDQKQKQNASYVNLKHIEACKLSFKLVNDMI